MTALLGGFVQVFSGELSELEGQIDAGRMRVLVVLSPERLTGPLASVPTALESGIDDLPPRAVPHPMLVPAPVEGREGRASSGTRATA